mgnify:CR=1 FL=1
MEAESLAGFRPRLVDHDDRWRIGKGDLQPDGQTVELKSLDGARVAIDPAGAGPRRHEGEAGISVLTFAGRAHTAVTHRG